MRKVLLFRENNKRIMDLDPYEYLARPSREPWAWMKTRVAVANELTNSSLEPQFSACSVVMCHEILRSVTLQYVRPNHERYWRKYAH